MNSFEFLKNQSQRRKVVKVASDAVNEAAFLGVVVNEETLYIPIEQIHEIVTNPSIVPVGHAKHWMRGLLKSQGDVYSVIDIATFLHADQETDKARILVALSSEQGHYAILVSAILGITKVRQLEKVGSNSYSITYKTADEKTINVFSMQLIEHSAEMRNMSVF